MRITKEYEQYYESQINSLLIVNPGISNKAIREQLLKNGIDLHRNYVDRVRSGIVNKRRYALENETLSVALGSFQAVMQEGVKHMWKIILSSGSSNKDRIGAFNSIQNAYGETLDKLFDSGVFERNRGKITINKIDPETEKEVRRIFEEWGINVEEKITVPALVADKQK